MVKNKFTRFDVCYTYTIILFIIESLLFAFLILLNMDYGKDIINNIFTWMLLFSIPLAFSLSGLICEIIDIVKGEVYDEELSW